MSAKLASQSTVAPVDAARPRTSVGNTSPCSSQPVPPTPMANEAMNAARPIITTTISRGAGEEGQPGRGQQGGQAHPDVPADGQLAAALPVDPAEREVGGGHVDRGEHQGDLDAGDGLVHQRAAALEQRAEQVRAVVQRHVDPGDLLEDEEHADHDQRAAHARGPLGAPLRAPVRLFQLPGGVLHVLHRDLGPEAAQRLLHAGVVAVPHQPPGRLRHLGPQREPDQRRDGTDAEDEPPVRAARAARGDLEDDQRHDVGDEDADSDHPLLQHAERAAAVPRRVLGDVGGGDGRVGPDGQPDQRPREQQHGGVRGDRGQDRADRVDQRVGDQQRLSGRTGRRSARRRGRRPRRRATHRPPDSRSRSRSGGRGRS